MSQATAFYDQDITSANAELILMVEELFPTGIRLENFGTDQSFSMDQEQTAEVVQGVDGPLSAGWVPSIKQITITLSPASPSRSELLFLATSEQANRKKYGCTMQIVIPSIRERHTFSNGVIQSVTSIPAGQRVLGPTTWVFNFGKHDIEKI